MAAGVVSERACAELRRRVLQVYRGDGAIPVGAQPAADHQTSFNGTLWRNPASQSERARQKKHRRAGALETLVIFIASSWRRAENGLFYKVKHIIFIKCWCRQQLSYLREQALLHLCGDELHLHIVKMRTRSHHYVSVENNLLNEICNQRCSICHIDGYICKNVSCWVQGKKIN